MSLHLSKIRSMEIPRKWGRKATQETVENFSVSIIASMPYDFAFEASKITLFQMVAKKEDGTSHFSLRIPMTSSMLPRAQKETI